ncbi:MAG: hypothetical protein ISS79_07345 [Phycisphaerae bacterium]|nr:hypothetical protein [Phycisphaerae bacterium]
MGKSVGDVQSRRQLFFGVLRYAALGLMCVGAGVLLAKRYRLKRNGGCINEGLCRGCGILDTCRLPLALSAKRILEE